MVHGVGDEERVVGEESGLGGSACLDGRSSCWRDEPRKVGRGG